MTFSILMKAGPLRNGAERGHGSIFHCVEGESGSCQAALCGARPSIQWSSWTPDGQEVTCERCLKLISLMRSAQEGIIRRPPSKGFHARGFTANAGKLAGLKLVEPNAHGDFYVTDRGAELAQQFSALR